MSYYNKLKESFERTNINNDDLVLESIYSSGIDFIKQGYEITEEDHENIISFLIENNLVDYSLYSAYDIKMNEILIKVSVKIGDDLE